MFGAKLTAASGLTNQQRRLDVIANNVANVNTIGFRGTRVDFQDAMYQTGVVPGRARTPGGNQQRGHGVLTAGVTRDFQSGALQMTERNLDVAINGEGFFTLGDLEGNLFYTRNGAFQISEEGGQRFLVNGNGLYILDTDGLRIEIPLDAQGIFIDQQGGVRFSETDDEPALTLAVYTFRNKMGLYAGGNGAFIESVASGERIPASGAEVIQGSLEMSNVDLSEQMTLMIRTQRAFQLASRALTTADEMEGIANNMRR